VGTAPSEARGQLVDAALGHASRGWPVLPAWWLDADGCARGTPDCAAPAKHPIGPLVRHGVLDAAIAAQTIVRWWRRFPGANVGIATGPASGIVVLDVDARHDGARHLEQLERCYLPLPRTVKVVTGGGRGHLYFAHRDGAVPTAAGGSAASTAPAATAQSSGTGSERKRRTASAQPLTTASGRRRATLRAMPARSSTSTTSATSL